MVVAGAGSWELELELVVGWLTGGYMHRGTDACWLMGCLTGTEFSGPVIFFWSNGLGRGMMERMLAVAGTGLVDVRD